MNGRSGSIGGSLTKAAANDANSANHDVTGSIHLVGSVPGPTCRANTRAAESLVFQQVIDRFWRIKLVRFPNTTGWASGAELRLIGLTCLLGSLEGEIDRLRNSLTNARVGTSSTETIGVATQSTLEPSLMPQAITDHGVHHQVNEQRPAATFEQTERIQERRPTTDLLLSLSSLYFRHIHPWFPFLDTQHILTEMATMEELPLRYYALFGASLPYSYDSRLDRKSSDSFWKYCKRRIFIEVLEEPSFSALEALTILVLDLSSMTNGPQVWGALAVAIKLAMQLKSLDGRVFRTSTVTRAEETPISADEIHRHRLFWAIYALDCYISITTSQPMQIADIDIHHFSGSRHLVWRDARPLVAPRWQDRASAMPVMPTLVFSYQLGLMDISRSVHHTYMEYATVAGQNDVAVWLPNFLTSASQLSVWSETLPKNLCLDYQGDSDAFTSRTFPAVVMLNAYYHGLIIHLHGLVSCSSSQRVSEQLHQDSTEQCAKSVKFLATAVFKMMDNIGDQVGWPLAWSFWVAARYLLIGENAGSTSRVSSQHFDTLLRCLKKMGRYCQISGKYWRLLLHAAAELRNDPASSDREACRMLMRVVDLRVSTSDLEDQFRTDPVFHRKVGVGDQDDSQSFADLGAPEIDRLLAARDASSVFASEDAYLDPSDQISNNWCNLPLYALSAYQQHPSAEYGAANNRLEII